MTVQLLTAADALGPPIPVQWQVDRILPEASTAIFYGAPGSKKTYALLDLAVCTALGKDWLGFPCKQGAVLIVDEESGPRRLLRRMGEVLRGHLTDASTQIFATSLESFNFWSPSAKHGARELEDTIKATGARVVIIDALVDCMLGGDENASKDTQKVFNTLRKIASATGACIIVIHHSLKNGNGYRGSSAIGGALDAQIEVTSEQGDPIVRFKVEKPRDGEAIDWAGECHWTPTEFWMTGTQAAAKGARRIYTKGERYVLEFLIANGNTATLATIEANADVCTARTARNAVYKLAGEHLIFRSAGSAGGTVSYTVDMLELAQHPL